MKTIDTFHFSLFTFHFFRSAEGTPCAAATTAAGRTAEKVWQFFFVVDNEPACADIVPDLFGCS